jgi:nitroreductase
MMTFNSLLKKRRSVRDFKDKEVPLEIIKEILQESSLAPSADNGQPCQFIIINNKKIIQKLSDECKQNRLSDYYRKKTLDKKLLNDDLQLDSVADENFIKKLKNKDYNVFYNAPCLIYVIGSKKVHSLDVDSALAASYIMLSATHRGLGTCWVNFGSYIRDPKIKEAIGIPNDCWIAVPIVMGYPKKIPEVSFRKSPKILKIIS